MKKHWVIATKSDFTKYDFLDDAINKAKIYSAQKINSGEYIVYEAVQVTKTPVPNIEMTIL